jgi:uncharacterized repeat protein (TIGR03803 family)
VGKLSSSKTVCIAFVFFAVTAIASTAQVLTTLASFNGTNGANPQAALVQGSDGNFYGTTSDGGAYGIPTCSSGGLAGCGTIFKITRGGTLTTLYSFCAQTNCPDGAVPRAELVQGADGNFYGTTSYGGSSNAPGCAPGTGGCGTVFKITPGGTLTTLYSFNATDGFLPLAGLAPGTDGNFYGTTYNGGANGFGGTAFKMTAGGMLTTLYSFCSQPNCADGARPHAVLVLASDGSFYGTTMEGGSHGVGTVFKITSGGALTTLYTFCPAGRPCPDGAYPTSPLVQATDGNFYGTTAEGGNGPGTVFKITPQGTLTTLHSFDDTDGASPQSGLVQATDGNLYGATSAGGANDDGTIFKITPGGMLTTLYSFCAQTGCPDGIFPLAAMVQATDGNFYGTTTYGGASGDGTVFSLNVGIILSPVEFFPAKPCRLLDTRGSGPIPGGTFQFFDLKQLAKLNPNCADISPAVAYSLNVTVVPRGSLGYLTIWPAGRPQPLVSTLNSYDARVKAVAAIVPGGASEAVSVFVTDTTDVILDIDGYFTTPSQQTLQFYPLTPCRVADTRNSTDFAQGLGAPYLMGGKERDFPVLNASMNKVPCNIPNSALAYSLNFTAVPHGSLGYLTVWPFGQPQPVVSTLNAYGGQVTANAAIVPAGMGGEISAFAYNDTDLLIDINGYFAPPGQGGLSLYPVVPCRVLDTRQGNGAFNGTLSPPVDPVNSPCAVPTAAQADVFNATVVPQGSLGYLTLWPDGGSQPVVSTLNAYDGAVTSNMAIVPAGNQGKVDAFAFGTTNLLLDISSYFGP